MERICIISSRYPNEADPTALTFVQQFAWALADEGKTVCVICPLPITRNKEYKKVKEHMVEQTPLGNTVNAYFPKYISLGLRKLAKIKVANITTHLFYRSVKKVMANIGYMPEVFYGHFITPSGLTACKLAKKFNIPSYIAYGESSTWSIDEIGRKRVKKNIANVDGIISVSTKNKMDLLETGVVDEKKIGVFPNGYLPSRFSKKDRVEARKAFGFPEGVFIVAFVGHFNQRKGVSILKEAIDKLDNVYMICAGNGDLKPEGKNVLFAQPVKPDELAMFYSAADVFVLPTLNEGCCNAIIEAMACGLPIVSSNLSFNDDILDDTNSLRIDPTNADEVATAINMLQKDHDLRKKLSDGSIKKSEGLTLASRVKNILQFMEKRK